MEDERVGEKDANEREGRKQWWWWWMNNKRERWWC
jgi:hypothetical protein